MMNKRHTLSGYTLIELMLVVAIIGILASIAIPSFQSYQLRARRGESYANLPAIARLQNAYFGEYGSYISIAVPQPGGGLSPAKRDFTPVAAAAFAPLGWVPEGDVYFDYDTNTTCGCTDCFTSTAYGDADADGFVAVTMYVHPSPSTGVVCNSGAFGFATPLDTGGTPLFDHVAVNTAADDF